MPTVVWGQLSQSASDGLTVEISFPTDESLVRGAVPLFGRAFGPEFRSYRVEYGEGREPARWHLLKHSTTMIVEDPFRAGKVKWDPNRGAEGNLATWQTGLKEYRYLLGSDLDLKGSYTLRLVVDGRDGRSVEDRVVVHVGRVVTGVSGGTVKSTDGKAEVVVAPGSIASSLGVFFLSPTTDVPPPEGLTAFSPVYELRPPGVQFASPARVRFFLSETQIPFEDGRLAIYSYDAVDRLWRRVPSRVAAKERTVEASVEAISQYVAYYGVFADHVPPAPPGSLAIIAPDRRVKVALAQDATALVLLERSRVMLEGNAEPLAEVRLSLGKADLVTAVADADGWFRSQALLVPDGENQLDLRVFDQAGNASAPVKLTFSLKRHPPQSLHSIRFVGPLAVSHGQDIMVCLEADASRAEEVDSILARAKSTETDPEGFDIELVETRKDSGVYVGLLRIAGESRPEDGILGCRKHREEIVAEAGIGSHLRVTRPYLDRKPPSAPVIVSFPLHSLRQWTFESETDCGPPEVSPIDGKTGAVVSVREGFYGRNLICATGKGKNHLGLRVNTGQYDPQQFPIVEFLYHMDPAVEIDLILALSPAWLGEMGIGFTDTKPYFPRLGRIHGVRRDDEWRLATVNLRTILRQAFAGRSFPQLSSLSFINLDGGRYMKRSTGYSGSRPVKWELDEVRIYRCLTEDQVSFAFWCTDSDDILGYSYVLERDRTTTAPAELVSSDSTERQAWREGSVRLSGCIREDMSERARALCDSAKATSPPPDARPGVVTFAELPDGRYYFHVRACDKAGNWGPANHHMCVIDRSPPIVHPPPTLEESVPWWTPIFFRTEDVSGIDPYTVRLEIDGQVYDAHDTALDFDPEKG
ncbi:MAG: hypothetical protein FJ279_04785 [Planctomycetes bacterium]|nr:hypothetical protein [Planctomycetota bacterium]